MHGRDLHRHDPGGRHPCRAGAQRIVPRPEQASRRGGLLGLPARPSPSDVENRWAGSDTSVNGRCEERRKDRKDTEMRKLIATEWISLDGVMQAPRYADEDRSVGSDRGGWHTRYFDDLSMNWVVETVRGAGGYLLGRGTTRFRRPLAECVGGGAGARRAAEYASEVRRVDDARRAAQVAALDAAQG
jgi:hypothetical protein